MSNKTIPFAYSLSLLLFFLLCSIVSAQVPTPGGVAGTVLWLKADAGTNTTTDGVGITSWSDQSGNGFDATGTGAAVYSTSNAINGNPVIYFTDDAAPITGTTITRGLTPNSSTEESTSFIVQRKSAITDDSFMEFYEGESRQFYLDRRYNSNNFFTLPTGVQQILSISDPGGMGPGFNSTIYLNSKSFVTSENLFSTTWENGAYVIGDDSTGSNELNGEIAEIIYYDYELTEANRKKIESYLAIKYGITLDNTDGGTDGDYTNSIGNTMWDASVNATYHNEVIGIGRDDESDLSQTKSTEFNSDPTLSIDKTTNFSNDLDYVIVGNDAASLAFNTTGVPAGITNISGRTWKVATNGTPGTITISINLGTSLTNSGNASEYALLIDTDADFSTGATIHTTGASINGNVLTFTNVSLSDGDFFTFAYTPVNEFPGNVSSGLTHWYKANLGTNTTTDGGAITTWEDQATSDGSDDATKTGTNNVTYQQNIHNYNPSILFQDGGDGHLSIANDLDQLAGTNYSVFAVVERTTNSNLGTNNDNYFLGVETTNNDEGFRFGYANDTRTQLQHDGTNNEANIDLSSGFVDSATEQPSLFKGIHEQGVSRSLTFLTATEPSVLTANSVNTNHLNSSTAGASIGRWRADRGFEGYVSEIIIYTDALSTTDQLKIESYLAVKYALTLDNSGGGANGDYTDSDANIIWDASENSTYHNEIIGIGRDDASALEQLKSSEPIASTNLTIEKTTSFSNNLDYVLVGNDNGTIGVTSTGTNPVYEERIARTWKASVSGSVEGLTISVNLPTTSTGSTSDYALLIDTDTDFSDSSIHTEGVSLDGDTVTFTNVNLSDGDVFTIGIGLSFGPANVTNGLTHWFRADTGITTDANGITIWENQANGNNATRNAGVVADYPVLATGTHNFNPSVNFINGDNGFFDLNLDDIKNSDYNVLAVVERSNTNDHNNFLGTTSTTDSEALRIGYRNDSSNPRGIFNHRGSGNSISTNFIAYNASTETATLFNTSLDIGVERSLSMLMSGVEYTNTNTSSTALTGTAPGVLGYGDIAGRGFEGFVSELIIYNADLTDEELVKIKSYLAIKYAITFDNTAGGTAGDYLDSSGNILWDASENAAYHNDVAGIGYDIASNLEQKQSKSANTDDILSISIYTSVTSTNDLNLGSFEDNLDYLLWGNNGTTTSIALEDHISTESACLKQLDRDWKISNKGNVSNLTLQFDLTAFASRDFNLIIDLDGDGDYTTGTVLTNSTGTITGDNIIFNNVDLPDGCVFTLVDVSSDIVYQVGAWTGGAGVDGEFDNSATDLLKSVEIKEDVTLSGSHNCKCLTISNGAKVTVATGEYLKVTNTLTSNGSIFLEGTAELIQTDDDTNSGTGQVYKILNELTTSKFIYNYLSSPINTSNSFSISGNVKINTGLTLEDNTDLSFINNDLDGFGTTYSTRWFHNLINSFEFTEIDENTTMAPGIGFTIKGTGQANALNFIGTPNNGVINVAITNGNFLLTGNPYPSTINADDFNTANGPSGTGVTEGAVYIWDQPTDTGDHFNAETDDSGGYATIINGVKVAATHESEDPVSGATVPTEFIKPGQGFIVYGTADGNIQYTNALRDGITFDGSRKFFEAPKTKTLNDFENRPLIRLGFEYLKENGNYFHRQLATVLEDRSSLEKEVGKDAFMFDYYNNDAYWIVDKEVDRFVITSVPSITTGLELPIGVVSNSSKEVTFMLDAVENFPNDILLLDKQEDIITNLKQSTYTTQVASGDHQNRFSMVFEPGQNLDTEYLEKESGTIINVQENSISVVLNTGTIKEVNLYDFAGKKVVSKTGSSSLNTMLIHTKDLEKQLYIIKIVTNHGVITKKIFLE